MIILLHGPDAYRRREKEKFYLTEFARKHSNIGIGRFSAADADWFQDFQAFLRNTSLFEPFKLTVLENIFEHDDEKAAEALSEELKPLIGAQNSTALIVSDKKPAKKFDFLLKKSFAVHEFPYPSGYPWELFIRTEAKKRGLNLSADAVRFVAAAYEGDTWGLVTELEKLGFLGAKELDAADLEKLDVELTPNFWALMQGLRSANRAQRLAALERVFAANEPAGKVFNIAAYQLAEKIPLFAEYDLAVKSGKMDYEEALLDLALR